jgi:DNA-binding response OmpR family regulator
MDPVKLLLLDDDESLLFNLKLFLEDENIKVTPAISGEEALEFVKKEKFDIAIVDIKLPGIQGDQFITDANQIDSDLKYLIHTGSNFHKIPSALSNIVASNDFVLQKPVADMEIFMEKINKILYS